MDLSDARLATRMDKVEKSLGTNIKEVRYDLTALKMRVIDNEAGLDSRIKTVVNRLTSSGGLSPSTGRQRLSLADQSRVRGAHSLTTSQQAYSAEPKESYKEEIYWRVRKSLRLWPVPGPDRGASLVQMLTEVLMMDQDFL